MRPTNFERFSGVMAIVVGICGFLYAIVFVILKNELLFSLLLLLIGVLSTAPLIAVFYRLWQTDAPFVTWAIVLALVSVVGSAAHGGYDLANAINSPAVTAPGVADLPSQIDPRGLLTFGFAGVAIFIVAWLIGRGKQFPVGISYLAYLAAVLLVVLYLARLIVLSPDNLIVAVPAILTGFIVNPILYI